MPNSFLKTLPSWKLVVPSYLLADEPMPDSNKGGPFFEELPLPVFEAFKQLVPAMRFADPECFKGLWPGEGNP